MATHPRARHAEQILLVSHRLLSIFFCSLGFFMRRFYYRPHPLSKKKKFWLTREGGRKPLFVFCTTERAILMAENEELLLLLLRRPRCSQSEINLRHRFLADSVSTLARPTAPPA